MWLGAELDQIAAIKVSASSYVRPPPRFSYPGAVNRSIAHRRYRYFYLLSLNPCFHFICQRVMMFALLSSANQLRVDNKQSILFPAGLNFN